MMRDSSSVRLIWSCGRDPDCGAAGLVAAGRLGGARGELGLVVGLFAGITLRGPDLDLAFGLGDGGQAHLAPLEFLGDAHAVGALGLELHLDGLGVPVG
jgi:hypothetical protein